MKQTTPSIAFKRRFTPPAVILKFIPERFFSDAGVRS